jgi:hypothetical protein
LFLYAAITVFFSGFFDNVSQSIFFDSFSQTRALNLGKIRLAEFVDKYEVGTLRAIIAELEK